MQTSILLFSAGLISLRDKVISITLERRPIYTHFHQSLCTLDLKDQFMHNITTNHLHYRFWFATLCLTDCKVPERSVERIKLIEDLNLLWEKKR